MAKKVAACTLGCKVNSYDTDAMVALFKAKGYERVDFSEQADIVIINTCTVTNLSSKKSRQMIRKARGLNADALVVAVGCYAQAAPDEVAAIPGVDLVLGAKDRKNIVAEVERYTRAQGVYNGVSDVMGETEYEELCASSIDSRTRAYLKIQDGCSQFCAYCIIPHVRGPVRSRRPADILAEAWQFAAMDGGGKEIVLTGIHVASYGKDLDGTDLCSVVQGVHAINGIARIRFGSLDPVLIDASFVAAISQLPKICDHFHLSLQSGCDKTLRRMNRPYTTAQYANAAALLRSAFPHVALTTDIIVGFPGETGEDFAESLSFVREMAFAKLHVFPYSPKMGTPAATFPDQVETAVKNARAKKMAVLGEKMAAQFASSMIGKTVPVLYESCINGNSYVGHTSNYITVTAEAESNIAGEIVQTLLGTCDGEGIVGTIVTSF